MLDALLLGIEAKLLLDTGITPLLDIGFKPPLDTRSLPRSSDGAEQLQWSITLLPRSSLAELLWNRAPLSSIRTP